MIIVDLPGGTRRSVTNVSSGGFEFNANAKKARARNATLKRRRSRIKRFSILLVYWVGKVQLFGAQL